uniref:Uncharacterized protein n=1 Tax=Rhizophora mucronata TaxID=61149 RepID=A0A2P2R199_RHIMU
MQCGGENVLLLELVGASSPYYVFCIYLTLIQKGRKKTNKIMHVQQINTLPHYQ